ncbi:MAG: phosphatase PAP2 family protein [Acetobacteraceae bacterium]
MNFLTDLSDEAVILPVAATVGLILWAQGWRRGALGWSLAVGGTLTTMLVMKLVGIACGPDMLRTPSGHTAAAAVVCGGLVVILGRGGRCRTVLLAAVPAAVIIGLLRWLGRVHTVPEVVLGGMIGIGGALILARLAGAPPAGLRARWVVGAVIATLVLFHGWRLPAEAHIRMLALLGARELRICRGIPASMSVPPAPRLAGSLWRN